MKVIKVDQVAAGRALVTGPGFSGTAIREGRRLRVELTESDTVVMDDPNGYVGHTSSGKRRDDAYRQAAGLLAARHGLAEFRVDIDIEQ